jgi:hypothetical protein
MAMHRAEDHLIAAQTSHFFDQAPGFGHNRLANADQIAGDHCRANTVKVQD